jgi:pseudouridine-5'-monophosphatase
MQGRPAKEVLKLLLSQPGYEHIPLEKYTQELYVFLEWKLKMGDSYAVILTVTRAVIQAKHFPFSKPLPGAEKLLLDLGLTENRLKAKKVHLTLATSSLEANVKIKAKHLEDMFSVFKPNRKIFGDDLRIPKGRGKPSLDIYLLALKAINESLDEGEAPITPAECLVLEDGIRESRRGDVRVWELFGFLTRASQNSSREGRQRYWQVEVRV